MNKKLMNQEQLNFMQELTQSKNPLDSWALEMIVKEMKKEGYNIPCCLDKSDCVPSQEIKYKIIFDNVKPYEVFVNSDDALIYELKRFYLENKDNDDYFTAYIYDSEGMDISDSLFIENIKEIIGFNPDLVQELKGGFN